MRKISVILLTMFFMAFSVAVFAGEGPMTAPEGSNPGVIKHNQEGINHWNQGHYDVALGHFQAASKADASIGQTHFNEAICLDKMGRHGEATMHFKAAKKFAHGNGAILNSPILKGHIGG